MSDHPYKIETFLLPFIFILWTWSLGQAQIIITRDDIPSTPGVSNAYYINAGGTVTVDVGEPGGPQTWDFGEGSRADSVIEHIVDKENTPFADLFPEATLVYDTNGLNIAGIDTASGFQYMRLADEGLDLLGAGSENVLGIPLALALDSSLTVLRFPLTYGVSWLDVTEYLEIFEDLVENPSPNPLFPDPYIDVMVEVNYSTEGEVDGWGTVVVPCGRFEALRVRRHDVTDVEISVFLGFGFVSVFDSTLVTITYDWYVEGLGSVVTVTSRPDEEDPDFSIASRIRRLFQTNAINRPPSITSDSAALAIEDRFFTYVARAEDPDGDSITIAFSDYPGWLSPTDSVMSGTPGEGSVDTSFLVIVSDGTFFDSLLVKVTVVAVNDPPSLLSLPDTSFVSGDSLVLHLNDYVEDVDSPEAALSWSAVSLEEALNISVEHGQALLTAPEYAGTTDVVFTVVDDSLASDSDTIGVIVLERPNRPPAVTSDSAAFAVEDKPFSYVARGKDPDGDPLFIFFAHYPQWLTPLDSMISGLPLEGTVDTSFVVIASDGDLADSLLVRLHVLAVNDPPVILHVPDTSFVSGDSLILHLNDYVEDVDSPKTALSWSAASLSEAVEVILHGDSAIFRAPDFHGEASVVFTVTDDSLASDTDTMMVTVIEPTGVTSGDGLKGPHRFWLSQNMPNPFNPVTVIRYQIGENRYPVPITLKIYNLLGQEVRILVDEVQEVGCYTVTWNGRDGEDRSVPSGLYLYRLTAGRFTSVRHMLLLK